VLDTVPYYVTKLHEPFKESSVCTWKNAYMEQLRKLRREGISKVKLLPSKTRGRPYLLGEGSGDAG